MRYVDGFVVPVPKRNVKAYLSMTRRQSKIWMEHGALAYVECAGDELDTGGPVTFPRLAKLKPGETVFFSYTVYKSKADRDRVNRKVTADPRMKRQLKKLPFDLRRTAFGGFKAVVDIERKRR
jgi:uncharacterized protein YbaA (DUF1428 family)